MTPERIRQITAEKIMGWECNSDGGFDPIEWYQKTGGYKPIITVSDWKPDLDRNQSRMVVEKAREILIGEQAIAGVGDAQSLVNARLLLDLHIAYGPLSRQAYKTSWQDATPLQECEACLRALGLWEEQ